MAVSDRAFQIFAKPVGPVCNLHCDYCYYLGKKVVFPGSGSFLMEEDVLERYIIHHIEATTDGIIFFSWHGGEPLMAGIDFYRKAVAIQRKHLPPGKILLNGIQTNGTLLNEEWCSFLAGESFSVGFSMDGPEMLHNLFRRDRNGRGSYGEVIRGYGLLREFGINPEILCVVNARNVQYPLEVYRHFVKLGAEYITFLPLVIPDPNSHSAVTDDSVPAKSWGEFLIAIFKVWVEDDIENVRIQIFEEAIRNAFDGEHTLCIFKVACGGVPVVEHNGDVYSCDHYVDREHFLGNLKDQSLSYYLDCKTQEKFGQVKLLTLPLYCKECPVLKMCNGECPKNRFAITPDGEPGLNYLCEGYRMFFSHISPFVEAIKNVAEG